MKSSQYNPNEVHHSVGNQMLTKDNKLNFDQANSINGTTKEFYKGIADRLFVVAVYLFIVLFIFLIYIINQPNS